MTEIWKEEGYEKYLKSLPDEDLIFIRNRVMWECKRRIAEGNSKLKEAGK